MLVSRVFKTCFVAADTFHRFKRSGPTVHNSQWLKNEIQNLGPTYVKVGQFLSARKDIIDKNVIHALKDLQDSVNPLDTSVTQAIMQKHLSCDEFREIELVPCASASIGQVHRGVLKNGSKVAIKLKRPNIEVNVREDVQVMQVILSVARLFGGQNISETTKILNDFNDEIMKETDYAQEVENIKLFTNSLKGVANVRTPQIYEHLCNDKLIVMEYVPCFKFQQVKTMLSQKQRSSLASRLMNFFVYQFINVGVIHGDPHEGNIGVNSKGELVVYDLGQLIVIDAKLKSLMKRLLFEIMTENVDASIVLIKQLDRYIEIRDETKLRAYVQQYVQYLKTIDISVFQLADHQNLPVIFDGQIFKLIRAFGIVEGICKDLDPDFNYTSVFVKNLDQLINDPGFLDYKTKSDLKLLLNRMAKLI